MILPQAVRRVAPPLLNDFVALQKDVALVSILGPQEAFRIAQIIEGKDFNFTPLIAAACSTWRSPCRWRGSSTAWAGPRGRSR